MAKKLPLQEWRQYKVDCHVDPMDKLIQGLTCRVKRSKRGMYAVFTHKQSKAVYLDRYLYACQIAGSEGFVFHIEDDGRAVCIAHPKYNPVPKRKQYAEIKEQAYNKRLANGMGLKPAPKLAGIWHK